VHHRKLGRTPKVRAFERTAAGSISFTGVLLVGGESRRMGSDKALLRCSAGEPLWSRQLKLLAQVQPQCIWISARTNPTWSPAGIEVVLDLPPARGPLSGLCACLKRLETTHLIVLAIDMPRMIVDHVKKLCSLARPSQSVLPVNGDYFEPLCAIYSKSAEPFASALLPDKTYSLQRLSQRLIDEKLANSYPLSTAEKSLYLNVNRREDM
jgi:molybdopterin-guanine dinucleotide biosynthesis protein A